MMKRQSVSTISVVLENSWWNLINFIFSAAGGLLVSIFFVRSLGVESYGVYALIFSLATISSLFIDIGLSHTIARYIPRYSNDPENAGLVRRLIRSVCIIQIVIWVFFVLFTLFFGEGVLGLVAFSDDTMRAIALVAIMSLSLPLVTNRLLSALFAALQKSKYAAIIMVISQVVLIIGGLYMLLNDASVFVALLLQLVALTAGTAYALLAMTKMNLSREQPTKSVSTSEALQYSLLSYVNTILVFIVWSYSEVFFLNHYWNASLVSYYTIAVSLGSMISAIPGLFLRSVYTSHFELVEAGEIKKAERILEIAVLWMTAVFLPVSTFLAGLAWYLIPLVYGSEYAPVGYVLPLVLFGSVISSTLAIQSIRANTRNSTFAVTVGITALGAVINIAVDFLLVPPFGLIGAGVASFMSQIILTVITVVYILYTFKLTLPWKRLGFVYIQSFALGVLLFLLTSLPIFVFLPVSVLATIGMWRIIFRRKSLSDEDITLFDSIIKLLPAGAPFVKRAHRWLHG